MQIEWAFRSTSRLDCKPSTFPLSKNWSVNGVIMLLVRHSLEHAAQRHMHIHTFAGWRMHGCLSSEELSSDEWMSNSEPNAYVQTLSHVVYSRLKKRDSEEIGIFFCGDGKNLAHWREWVPLTWQGKSIKDSWDFLSLFKNRGEEMVDILHNVSNTYAYSLNGLGLWVFGLKIMRYAKSFFYKSEMM